MAWQASITTNEMLSGHLIRNFDRVLGELIRSTLGETRVPSPRVLGYRFEIYHADREGFRITEIFVTHL